MSTDCLEETDAVYKSPQKKYNTQKEEGEGAKLKEKEALEELNSLKPSDKYPKTVFLIILNEFCERFSYYGFRTVLFIFFTNFIKLPQNTATAIYHTFTTICYFTPVLGAVLADGYIGLYKTIISLSILYFIGEVILTLTSMQPLGAPNIIGPAFGLVIIAIGTGGIKPCVSAFGGNQFQAHQKRYLETYFSLFYLSINIGSTIGTLLTPIFRNDVKCFGGDCYPLAFGVPAAFMLTAIVFFIAGTPYYRRDNDKAKGSDNVISKTFGCIATAIRHKFAKSGAAKKSHWLDYAEVKYSKEMISDVKAFCRVIVVFLPLPVFWALYDQQGSRWTSQAQQLNGRIGSWTIKPDQFQAVNPILIVGLVPLFDLLIYPFFSKCNLLKKQLQRMSLGLIFAIIAFLIAAGLEWQMQLKTNLNNPPDQTRLINLSPCDFQLINKNELVLNMNSSVYLHNKPFVLPDEFLQQNVSQLKLNAECKLTDGSSKQILNQTILMNSLSSPRRNLLFYYDERKNVLNFITLDFDLDNIKIGFSELRFTLFNTQKFGALIPAVKNSIVTYSLKDFNLTELSLKNSNIDLITSTEYITVDYADYELRVSNLSGEIYFSNEERILLETCGRYTVILFPSVSNSSELDYVFLADIRPNGIHLAWQLIQIFVMTIGEIMFSISGLSFAYSQAPASMKSVLQASWCLTVAFGNLIVVIVAEARFVQNQVHEYLLFVGLLSFATLVFMVLSWFYKYSEEEGGTEDEEKKADDKEKRKVRRKS